MLILIDHHIFDLYVYLLQDASESRHIYDHAARCFFCPVLFYQNLECIAITIIETNFIVNNYETSGVLT
jgi:hypothetical protein